VKIKEGDGNTSNVSVDGKLVTSVRTSQSSEKTVVTTPDSTEIVTKKIQSTVVDGSVQQAVGTERVFTAGGTTVRETFIDN